MNALLAGVAVLLLAAATAPAPKSPLSLTLEVVPEEPSPGERVYWVARLTNTSKNALFIPADTRRFLSVAGFHWKPDDAGGFGTAGGGYRQNPPPLEWQKLEAGESLELAGSAGDVVEACRSGCPEGLLELDAQLTPDRPPGSPGTDATHLVPERMTAQARVSIASRQVPVLERRDVGALEARVLKATNVDGHARLQLRLVNRTDQPLWIPAHVALEADCVMTSEDGGSGISADVGRASPRWNEKSSVLLKPGAAHETAVSCTDALPARGSVEVRLRPASAYESSRPLVPPFAWSGEVKAPAFPVGGTAGPQK